MVGLQKIIKELQEKLAIATGKSRTNSKTSSQPPPIDLIQKSEKAKEKVEEEQKRNQVDNHYKHLLGATHAVGE